MTSLLLFVIYVNIIADWLRCKYTQAAAKIKRGLHCERYYNLINCNMITDI